MVESFQEQIQNIHHTQIGDTWHNGSKGSDKWEVDHKVVWWSI